VAGAKNGFQGVTAQAREGYSRMVPAGIGNTRISKMAQVTWRFNGAHWRLHNAEFAMHSVT